MNMKVLMISLIAMLLVAMSGCTEPAEPEGPVTTADLSVDGVELKNIPEGFEYLGNHSLEIEKVNEDYANVTGILQAKEGIYNRDAVDYFVIAIELDSAEAAQELVSQYKDSFPPIGNGDRFAEESFNGHDATRVTKFITANGEQVPRYHYIWTNENFVLVVRGNTDDSAKVLELAEATGF